MRITIVLPAYNEERIIARNARKLYDFVKSHLSDFDWKLVIADNNSSDGTQAIAQMLASKHNGLEYVLVGKKGKGNAVLEAWKTYRADVYVFMDADLATDISALPALIGAIVNEGYDISCGSRFIRGSIVKRGRLRKITSFLYRILVRLVLHTKINDLPCGFKAINKDVHDQLLSKVKNREWFFDSELIIMAERAGYRIKEIPVHWIEKKEDGRKSKVKIFPLAISYVKQIFSLKKRFTHERK